jgi:hypothetical protein
MLNFKKYYDFHRFTSGILATNEQMNMLTLCKREKMQSFFNSLYTTQTKINMLAPRLKESRYEPWKRNKIASEWKSKFLVPVKVHIHIQYKC